MNATFKWTVVKHKPSLKKSGKEKKAQEDRVSNSNC